MATRRLEVEIVGNTRGLERSFARARSSTSGFARNIGGFSRGVASGTGALSRFGGALALTSGGFFAGAGLVAGFRAAVGKAAEFQGTMNVLQSVSHATAGQMAAAGRTAQKLGADVSLPATSAKDAAGAMTELAKGGLSIRDAMAAARGTLQLSAAAQIDGAQAATIQANALNQFGLSGDKAGQVADILANSANAASGEITDMATALSYVGPVAAGVGETIGNTGTAVALLAKNGILGDKAGTALRAMIASLAHPSRLGKKGLQELGLQAFDARGHFVGFRSVIEQLNEAQGKLTKQQFASASAMVFGREPLAAIIALASAGGTGFDQMSKAVNRQGGAAQVAAARNKGFTGAMDALKSTIETVEIQLGSILLPTLTRYLRVAANWLGDTRNQVRIQQVFRQALAVVGATFRTVAGVVRTFTAAAGGAHNAVRLLAGAFVALQTVRVANRLQRLAGEFTGLAGAARRGNTAVAGGGLIPNTDLRAGRATKSVATLGRRLRGLGSLGINPIVIPIAIATIGDKLTGGHHLGADLENFVTGKHHGRSLGNILFGSGDSTSLFNTVSKALGHDRSSKAQVPDLDRVANAQARQLNPGRGVATATAQAIVRRNRLDETKAAAVLAASTRTRVRPGLSAEQRNQFFDAAVGRRRDRIQDLPLRQQSAALGRIGQLITQRIGRTKDITRRLTLEDQLLEVTRQRKDIRSQLQQQALDAFQFNVDRAQTTAGFGDDLRALGVLRAALIRRVATDKGNLDLQRQLLQVNSQIKDVRQQQRQQQLDTLQFRVDRAQATAGFGDDIRALTNLRTGLRRQLAGDKGNLDLQRQLLQVNSQIKDARDQQRQARTDALKRRQFRQLGLTAEGEDVVPGVQNLRRRLGSLTQNIRGTFLDTDKTRAQTNRIRRVLSEGLVPRDVRAKLREMLDGLSDELKNHQQRNQTAFRHESARSFLSAAGLNLSPAERRRFNSLFAQVGAGGTRPGTRTPAFAGAGGATVIHNRIDLDGRTVARNTTEHQRRAESRRSPSRRGPYAGRH